MTDFIALEGGVGVGGVGTEGLVCFFQERLNFRAGDVEHGAHDETILRLHSAEAFES